MTASTIGNKARKILCAVSAVLLGALILGGCAPSIMSWYGAVDRGILETCNQAIAQEPNRMDHFRDRGMAHFTMGELDKAIEDFNSAISMFSRGRPDYWWLLRLYRARGDVYLVMGNMDMALADYNNAIEYINMVAEKDCSDLESLARRGENQEMCYWGYTNNRDVDAAYRNMCYVLYRLGDIDKAREACEKSPGRSFDAMVRDIDNFTNRLVEWAGNEQMSTTFTCRVRK